MVKILGVWESGWLEPKVEMTDTDLVQLICAFRLLDEDVELSISTRESEIFRNNFKVWKC